MEIIGKNLVMLREALGLTQAEVAEKMGVSREYVSKIEGRERTNISRPVLESICRWLNTTEEWLTEGLGWVYEPPSIYEAMYFVDGCLKLKPEAVAIVTYANSHRTTRGFIFTTHTGTLSMSGGQTQSDCPKGNITFREALRMIEKSKIPAGHVLLYEKESVNVLSDMEMLIKNARYGETDLENN